MLPRAYRMRGEYRGARGARWNSEFYGEGAPHTLGGHLLPGGKRVGQDACKGRQVVLDRL